MNEYEEKNSLMQEIKIEFIKSFEENITTGEFVKNLIEVILKYL